MSFVFLAVTGIIKSSKEAPSTFGPSSHSRANHVRKHTFDKASFIGFLPIAATILQECQHIACSLSVLRPKRRVHRHIVDRYTSSERTRNYRRLTAAIANKLTIPLPPYVCNGGQIYAAISNSSNAFSGTECLGLPRTFAKDRGSQFYHGY